MGEIQSHVQPVSGWWRWCTLSEHFHCAGRSTAAGVPADEEELVRHDGDHCSHDARRWWCRTPASANPEREAKSLYGEEVHVDGEMLFKVHKEGAHPRRMLAQRRGASCGNLTHSRSRRTEGAWLFAIILIDSQWLLRHKYGHKVSISRPPGPSTSGLCLQSMVWDPLERGVRQGTKGKKTTTRQCH